ncbi:Autophagy-related protein 2 [Dissostichus eleginoides]|uniref:Autophagy-related protein 2 n=1 Tax=Dissostichus eleginoides TaxID=100907 RepID=A0AAD9CDU1_DISEL|nr:Autophagy-related protein 2 [Dissostichus eleginoides]
MVPSTEALFLEAILSGEKAWPWQLPNSDSFDLRTKRRAFDLVMAVKRLEEGKKILVTEMNHHWKVLSTRSDSLKELSCLQNSPLGLSEDGMKGLQIMFRKKHHDIREIKTHARRRYLHVLTGAETISFLQSLSDESSDCDSDSSDDTCEAPSRLPSVVQC